VLPLYMLLLVLLVVLTLSHGEPMQFLGESPALDTMIALQVAHPQGNGADGFIEVEYELGPGGEGDATTNRRRMRRNGGRNVDSAKEGASVPIFNPRINVMSNTTHWHSHMKRATLLVAGPNFLGPGESFPG
jgi:hypothetical protein